jgi:hypothetical protein
MPYGKTKRCPRCSRLAGHDVYKPLSEFYWDMTRGSPDIGAASSRCKECMKEQAKELYYKQKAVRHGAL